jgi:hypothetical protein
VFGWVFVLIICTGATAFYAGRRFGILEANRSAAVLGAWVVVKRPVACKAPSSDTESIMPAGIQGLVTGVDKWGKLSIWIGQPWSGLCGPKVYGVTDMASLRVQPLSTVPREILDPTLTALAKWEAKTQGMEDKLFPPGFLEVQALLNKG